MDFNDGIDYSEISQENINDETLISIVRKNRMLYVKTLKDYKNKELKHEVWKNIGEMLGCTVTGSDDNISNPSLDEILSASTASSIASPIASDHQSVVTSNDLEDDVSECTNNRVQKEIAANVITKTKDNKVIQKKKVVPPLDQFAIKKQKRTETLENVLCQSSHALNVMASAYLHRSTDEEKPQQQQQQHPYITAIAEAMKQVPHEQQLTCFMSIMQVISTQCGKVMEK
ncbi:hypothetical protein DMN91_008696 [Ooceraea biroi]|uniref:MADF domain-containing protein n=1 Tax=Ooceraea biroi TaxID=2015173 RepID=A0A3L8DEL6_OOCBI|nr:hypothetical protein DMN91_008696 [Ooceraea biroi]